MIEIKEVCDRNKLCEGRSSGVCHGFLKKISDTKYETVVALTACKDFLNEPVFTELTNIKSYAHGLTWEKKLGIFEDKCYLGMKVLNMKHKPLELNELLTKEKDLLKANYKHVESLLNWFEDKVGLKEKSSVIACKDDYYLVIGSNEWCVSTIAMSLYTLLQRVAIYYDGTKDPMVFLKEFKEKPDDTGILKSAILAMEVIIENKRLPEQPSFNEEYAKLGRWSPHNSGICSWNRTYKKELIS